jgi:carbamoyltransferase
LPLLRKKDSTRIKHDPSYPYNAIEFVLKYANLKLSEVDQIVFFEKPFLKFERLLETYVAFAPRDLSRLQKQCHYGLKKNFFKKTII